MFNKKFNLYLIQKVKTSEKVHLFLKNIFVDYFLYSLQRN